MGELINFDMQVPAHLRAASALQANDDLSAGVSIGFPIMSIKGKNWHFCQGDDRILVTNADGDPKSSIEAVIVKANSHVSKVYYESGYTEGSDEKPTCWSHDGIAPDLAVETPVNTSCKVCPYNMFGSKITENGNKAKACADSRRVAIVAADDLEEAMLLRIPAASLKDLAVYAGDLKKRGVVYNGVVTKIGFDAAAAYPKLTFRAVRYLSEGEFSTVTDTADGPVVEAIIGSATEFAEAGPAGLGPAPAHLTAPVKAAAKKTTAITDEEVAAAFAPTATAAPKAEPKPAAAPKAAKGFGNKKGAEETAPQTVAAAPVQEPPPPSKIREIDLDAGLDELLSGWDD